MHPAIGGVAVGIVSFGLEQGARAPDRAGTGFDQAIVVVVPPVDGIEPGDRGR